MSDQTFQPGDVVSFQHQGATLKGVVVAYNGGGQYTINVKAGEIGRLCTQAVRHEDMLTGVDVKPATKKKEAAAEPAPAPAAAAPEEVQGKPSNAVVNRMKKADLVTLAGKLGLDTTGTVEDLRARIRD